MINKFALETSLLFVHLIRHRRLRHFMVLFALMWQYTALAAPSAAVDLSIDQLSYLEKQSVLASISLYQQRQSPFLTQLYVQKLQHQGEDEIRAALQALGFYRSKINSRLQSDAADQWTVFYEVEVGPPVPIKDLQIDLLGEGRSNENIQKWISEFPLRVGDTLDQQKYEAAKKELMRILGNYGYLQFHLQKHQIQIDLKDYGATISLSADTGPQHKFGEVTFLQDKFDPDYLRRFLPFQRGEPFNTDKLRELQRALVSSLQFENVQIDPKTKSITDLEVPIEVRLKPRKRTRYAFGVGYGTDTGPRLSGGIEWRRINRRGHMAGIEAMTSEVRSLVKVNYRIPLKDPANDYLKLEVGSTTEDTDDTYRRTDTLSANFVHGWSRWRRTLGLAYETEDFEVSDEHSNSQLLIPSVSWQLFPEEISLAKPMNFQFDVTMKGATAWLVSDTTFAQVASNAKFKLRFADRWSLLTRATVGTSLVPDFEELPVSLRFFAGGDQSIRGFAFNSLGPDNPKGDTVGGKHILVGSAELQYKFLANWDVATFVDAGNAFDNLPFTVQKGVGVGIGWNLPFGVLRVYAANALTKDDNPWRFHLLLGYDI